MPFLHKSGIPSPCWQIKLFNYIVVTVREKQLMTEEEGESCINEYDDEDTEADDDV